MLIFIDDYTQKSQVYLTIDRVSLLSIFAYQKALVECQSGYKLIAVRSDNSPEYRSLGGTILADQGIIHKQTVAYMLEQNGLLERLNYSLITIARLILLTAKLLLRFQGFAVQTTCYLQNRIAIRPEGKSLEEAFTS